jgi:plastocyanin
MTRTSFPLVLILGLLAAACAEQTQAEVEFGSGKTFTTFVADAQDDVGQMPSVGVSPDGVPYVAYFGFPEEVAEGEVAAPRPIDTPPLPGVLLTSVDEGIWTRGAVAIEQNVPNSQVPFGPAEEKTVASMEPDNVAGTATAVDANGGIHVAWASDTGIWYGHNPNRSAFDVTQVFKLDRKLSVAGPLGAPSIAVDQSGTPWIAFSHAAAGGVTVVAASLDGSEWTLEEVATFGGQAGAGRQPGRTGIALSDGAPIVVYGDGNELFAATPSRDGEGWEASSIANGTDGTGISATTGADGTVLASFYAGTEVQVAVMTGGEWRATTVATVGDGENLAGRSTGVGADESGTVYVTWYDPASDEVHLASGKGDAFEDIETSGTEGGSQPALGVAPDGSTVDLSWFDTRDQNLMLGTYGETGELALAVPSPTAAPTGTAAAPPSACTPVEDGVVTITASGLAFDTTCIEVPAGEGFTIAFDNQDAGVQHNVAVYPSADDLTNPIMKGDVITGVDQIEYQVDPLDEGEYHFQCDIHPTSMTGTVRVVGRGGGGGEGGGGGGAGGGGGGATTETLTAASLAFDTDTISLPADEATTLTFDNQDASVQHNMSIYPASDQVSPDTALFQGDAITGPDQIDYQIPALEAGEYYFQCDIHPDMNGTVVVG